MSRPSTSAPGGGASSAPSRPRARHQLTARGRAALVVGILLVVGAYALHVEELLIAGSLGILLAVTGYVFVRVRRPRLSVTRAFSPPVVIAGRRAHTSLLVSNRGMSTTVPAVWNDTLPWFDPSAVEQPLAPIAPRPAGSAARPAARPMSGARNATGASGSTARGSRRLEYDLDPHHRGVFSIGPLAVEFSDPFGMARSVAAIGGVDELVVVPDLVELPSGALSVAEGEGSSLLVHRRVTGSDDDLTTREYRIGDALRRVHWRASARHGELMVRQEEQRSHPESRILVDTRLSGYSDARPESTGPRRRGVPEAGTEQSESFEWTVRMLASLGLHLAEAGFVVSIDESAPRQVHPLGDRADGARRDEEFLRSLADIRLLPGEGVGLPTVDQHSGGPVFALLAQADDETLRWVTRHRRPGEAAVAFLTESGGAWRRELGDDRVELRTDAVRQTLQDSGWLVLVVDADADPVDAWRAAHAGWGSHRGGR